MSLLPPLAAGRVRGFRIVKSKYQAAAWSGEGAARYPGRWNSRGVPVVYCATNLSLAAMEMLVHMQGPILLARYRWAWIELDAAQVAEAGTLPPDWSADPAPAACKSVGDAWAAASDSPALRVPSAVVPGEANLLLNPAHPAFAGLMRGDFADFRFDPRLLKR